MSAHDQFVLQMGGGLTWLAKRNELTSNELMSLSALVLLDGPEGCRPTQERIAEVSGLGRGVIFRALKSLEQKSLIAIEEYRYRDNRKRERKKRFYVLSVEIEHAIEFATETFELRRRSTQPSLFPVRATVARTGNPSSRDSRAERDQDPPLTEQQSDFQECLFRATGDQTGMPHSRDSRAERDPSRATVARYIGGGGKKDQYMTMIRSYTPTPSPTHEERDLSMQMMTHSAIRMPRDFAQAIAARWSPREVLERCRAYSADYNAEGGANGVGALIYRFAHPDSYPNREIRGEDMYDHEWYSEFEYLVGLQEGLYVPDTEEEEPNQQLETEHVPEEAGPRPALVLADTLTDSDTAEAVFNTMELPAHRLDEDQQAWEAVVAEMAMVLPAATYHTWLHGQTEFVRSTDGEFTIRTASAYVRDCLHMRLKKKMETALQAKAGRSVEIEFLTSSQIAAETKGNDCRGEPESAHELQAVQADQPVLQPSGRI